MELVVVEFDTGAELDVTKCVEVAGAELVGGMDLGSGRGSGWSAAATGGMSTGGRRVGAGEWLGRGRRR